jgi:hypothetical protein
MTKTEMKNYKNSLKTSIADYDSRNDITMRNQKIKQLIDACTDAEISRLPKWYKNI